MVDKVNLNGTLQKAKDNKNDEFYTLYQTVKNELDLYASQFKDKVIYCNCDNPEWSNFWKYFYNNFQKLQLKELRSTYYNKEGNSVLTTYNGLTVTTTPLNNNGDFRKNIDLIKTSDIIATNPPFSLYREFVDICVNNNVDYIVIASMMSIGYKNIFNLLKDGKMNIGMTLDGVKCYFAVPDDFVFDDNVPFKMIEGKRCTTINNTLWFTSLQNARKSMSFWKDRDKKEYVGNENLYEIYDNYDAIEIEKLNMLPIDFDGVMGVPITFFKEYNPDEFEIVGFRKGWDGKDLRINNQDCFNRILIKNKVPTRRDNLIADKIFERYNKDNYQLTIFDMKQANI